jgi:membrane protease YdiL (CAAX protease family)
MSELEIPPILPAEEPPPSRPKWRWAVSLIVLVAYVLGLGQLHMERDPALGDAGLPNSSAGLILFCVRELAVFGIFFAIVWLFAKPRAEELYFKWRNGIMPVVWGAAHSVLLRVGLAILLLIVIMPMAAIKGEKAIEEDLKAVRPKVEAVVEPKALKDPLYVALTMTLISFVMAGFREELWRAGMLAGLAGIAPRIFASRKGQYFAVVVAAIIFGLAHAPQGAGGMVLTGLLGLGLGGVMVAHRSFWVAALAHGFFDATTFGLLYAIMRWAPRLLNSFGIF